MPEASPPAASGESRTVVVLLVPEELSDIDTAKLRTTLTDPARTIRALVCLTESDGAPLLSALKQIGIAPEILCGPEVAKPDSGAFILHAPPKTLAGDQLEFALALSDALVSASPQPSKLVGTALSQKKPVVIPGNPLPAIKTYPSPTENLDPDLPGWRGWGRCVFGRLEQFILELFAFAWLGWSWKGLKESGTRLGKCFWSWGPVAYFAPEGWKKLASNLQALETSPEILVRYAALDRSALYGSYIHRDFVWITHIGAAIAVFAAVAGHLWHWNIAKFENWGIAKFEGWGIVEFFVLLGIVALVWASHRKRMLDRWTACRLGAEQLRIARMSLPLLVLPQALATADAPQDDKFRHGKPKKHKIDYEFRALAEVKRLLRDHGLPRLRTDFTPMQAAEWLHHIVADQITYHSRNRAKLEAAETRLGFTTGIIFGAALIAVVLHFFVHDDRLLLLTAAGPAFAAAFHGAGTRLGIVHRAALSHGMEKELEVIDTSLRRLIDAPGVDEKDWEEVRSLAYKSTNAMGSENQSWHGLVRRYRDELPA